MARMTQEQIAAALDQEISSAWSNITELQDNRRDALDYIYGRKRGDEIEGRSQVVSTDVADMIHAVLSQVMPGLAGTDFPCEFMAESEGDEEAAKAESLITSKVIMNDNDGYQLIYNLVWNALGLKNGWAKVWAEDDQVVQVRDFPEASPSDMEQAAAQQVPDNVELRIDGTRLKRVTTRKVVKVMSVEPENMLYPQDAMDLESARFIAERKLMARGELVELGFSRKKVAGLAAHTVSTTSTDTTARLVAGVEEARDAPTRAQDKVEVFEIYTALDVRGDGIGELTRYLFADKQILDSEPVDFLPYVTGSGWPVPGRLTANSLYDKLKTVQDINTALIRSNLDAFQASNYQEVVVNETVNVDDFLNRRPAGINRVEGDVRAAVMPMPITPQMDAGLQMLQFMKGIRAERGGAALEMQGGEMQMFGQSTAVGSLGVDRIMSVQEQLAGMVAKNLAVSLIKPLFALTHRVIRTKLDEPVSILMAGQWQRVDPITFKPRNYVSLKAGLTQGEQSRKQAALAQLMSLQQSAVQQGQDDVLVNIDNLHTAYMDFARSNGIEAPERYFIDPQSPEAQQARQQKAQQGQQQQQLALALQQMDKQIELLKLQEKWREAVLKSEVEEAKIIADTIGIIEKQSLDAAQAASGPAGSAGGGAGPAGANGAQAGQ